MTQTREKPDAIAALARRFFSAIEAGDADTAADCYAPQAGIWHNTDRKLQSKEESLATLKMFVGWVRERRYEDVRFTAFPGGFVQQHRTTGILPDGTKLDMPACIVCEVENGQITRLDEYFDSATLPGA